MSRISFWLGLSVFTQVAMGQTGALAVVRSTGQLDRDGTALYSVYVASGNQDLGDLTIAAAMPPGTRFLATVHQPKDGVYEGVKDDIVVWTVPQLERDSLIGPFVFRVKRDGTVSDLPVSVQAAVAHQRPEFQMVESPPPEGKLVPLADRGSIVIDERGTMDADGRNAPVFIGGTGILLFVPEGAVSARVTISATRLAVDESKLPKTDPPTWWCSLYEMTSDPQVTFTKQISLAMPARRALTPGLPVSVFTSPGLTDWSGPAGDTRLKMSGSQRELGFGAFGFGPGACQTVPFGFTSCTGGLGFGFGGFGAFGFVEQDNIVSKIAGNKLTQFGSSSAAGLLGSPPGIIAILIGLR